MAMVGGAYTRDKNTCARTLAENVGGGLYARRGVYAGHYGTYIYELLGGRGTQNSNRCYRIPVATSPFWAR